MIETPHAPVLLNEVVAAVAPTDGEIIIDCTFGAGGYSSALLNAASCRVFAFDRDPRAIAAAQEIRAKFQGRLFLIESPFSRLGDALSEHGVDAVDAVVLDLGVSSMQLDEADRGFSFMRDGPLSMRMDGKRPDARDVVNSADERDLAAIFRTYGEERKAGRIARAIVLAREVETIGTTGRLAEIVARANPPRPTDRIHPATRVFQALRIFVNDELGELATVLIEAERLLRPDGRLVVVTFHSLEDRIVKRFIADRSDKAAAPSRHAPTGADAAEPTFSIINSKPIVAGEAELLANPRARSAKLRAAARTHAAAKPARAADYAPPLTLSRSLSQWSPA
jgi:16S rRNA (cytosine1402-N4)-methyltransferase